MTGNGLSGTLVACDLLTVAGNINYMNTVLYKIRLIDRDGEHQTMHLYEIDDIYCHLSSMSMESILQFSPSVSGEDIACPLREVDISIGMEYRKIPNISPGLIEVRKHFFEGAYIRGGLYSEGILC